MDRKQVGGRIRKLRELKHYTRESLAEKVEISPKFLYEIETGRKGFSAEVLCLISKTLSASSDYILFGKNEKNRDIEEILYMLDSLDSARQNTVQTMMKIINKVCECE